MHPPATVKWLDLLGEWPLIVADFSDVYGIRLITEYPHMLWQEFRMLASGLLSVDSRLARRFAPEPETASEN